MVQGGDATGSWHSRLALHTRNGQAADVDAPARGAGVSLGQRAQSAARQYGLDFGLWTRAVLGDLIAQKFGITLGLSAVGALLRIPANVTADSGSVTGIPVNVTEGRYCAF